MGSRGKGADSPALPVGAASIHRHPGPGQGEARAGKRHCSLCQSPPGVPSSLAVAPCSPHGLLPITHLPALGACREGMQARRGRGPSLLGSLLRTPALAVRVAWNASDRGSEEVALP